MQSQNDILFREIDGQQLKLNIYQPNTASEQALPLIVYIHGGAWRENDHNHIFSEMTEIVTGAGFVVASIGYRLSPAATHPAQIEDCTYAVQWLRANAEQYRYDATRIGVWGHSAGGHLAALLGVTSHTGRFSSADLNASARVHAACTMGGIVDLTLFKDYKEGEHYRADVTVEGMREMVRDYLGDDPENAPERTAEANPITHINAQTPPTMIVHGDKDGLIPIDQAERLQRALVAADVDTTFLRLNTEHGLQRYERVAAEEVAAFFDWTLRG
jgi:acetyl esterase/lipase